MSLLICSFVIGLLFHAYQQEWFVLLVSHKNNYEQTITTDHTFQQKKIILSFWKNNKWHKESTHIIWSSEHTQNIKSITNNWFILLEDEKIIENDMQALSAVISGSKELLLSLNKNPFNQQDSTFVKLMIIQGLLKTFKENKLPIQSVRFLIHHQIFNDDHLNFSVSWPITGYA